MARPVKKSSSPKRRRHLRSVPDPTPTRSAKRKVAYFFKPNKFGLPVFPEITEYTWQALRVYSGAFLFALVFNYNNTGTVTNLLGVVHYALSTITFVAGLPFSYLGVIELFTLYTPVWFVYGFVFNIYLWRKYHLWAFIRTYASGLVKLPKTLRASKLLLKRRGVRPSTAKPSPGKYLRTKHHVLKLR